MDYLPTIYKSRNEKHMTQRQFEATELTSQPAGTGKLYRVKIIDSVASKLKKLACFGTSVDERVIEQIQTRHPLKKLLTPTEVADTAVYLGNASQQVNGTHIAINAAQNIL